MFLYWLSWLSTVIHILFFTLALAAGLYYLAEVVEEYTVTAEKVIRSLIYITAVVFVCMYIFENFPFYMFALGLASCVTHYFALNDFPCITLFSPAFIVSCVFCLVNHYVAFKHFATVFYPFAEILAYFTICLWLVPFSLFISLTANEYVLPTTIESSDNRKSKKRGLFGYMENFFKGDSGLPVNRSY